MVDTINKQVDREYFFEDINDLISHLQFTMKSMSPIRLQKTLYFLYAFYGATYGSLKKGESISEVDQIYPKELFPAEFEAWEYGPVIRDVYFGNKDDKYDGMVDATANYSSEEEKDVVEFLDSLTDQLNQMSDFAMVDRSHSDKAWTSKFDPTNKYANEKIDNGDLVEEYRIRIREASAI